MANYRIFETDEFQKQLQKFGKRELSFIQKKLREYVYPQIKQEPAFGKNIKKLKNYSPDTWRYRIGKFRIFYSLELSEKIINILTIDFRKDAYK